MTIPYVIEKDAKSERTYDLYSRMLEDRIIFLNGEINNYVSNSIVAQLIYLESRDAEKDIYLYINSPGGSVTDGMAIYDTMRYIKCDVNTICIGMAASMAALLLSAGEKGKRFALPNSEIMIHQPSGGVAGQASEIAIVADRIQKTKKKLNEILAECSGQPIAKVAVDTDRDYYMDASEALAYGLIDKIYVKRE